MLGQSLPIDLSIRNLNVQLATYFLFKLQVANIVIVGLKLLVKTRIPFMRIIKKYRSTRVTWRNVEKLNYVSCIVVWYKNLQKKVYVNMIAIFV